MCGIAGFIARDDVTPKVMQALKTLEYRGYDSAGIAVADADGRLVRRRAVGKLKALDAVLKDHPVSGTAGIGHTRWATHGPATEANAHPHAAPSAASSAALGGATGLCIVHNGIIENYAALKQDLIAGGAVFESDTDTEVIAHLMAEKLGAGRAPIDAFSDTLGQLQGAFALAVLMDAAPGTMFIARRGSPMVIGTSPDQVAVASDTLALVGEASYVIYLEEGDWGTVSLTATTLFREDGRPVARAPRTAPVSAAAADKGPYRHFMLKEIYEQPDALAHTIGHYSDPATGQLTLPDLPLAAADISRIVITACGTAAYAGMVGKYWLEAWTAIPVEVDIASEYRYRHAPVTTGTLTVVISQSGETADTLAAMRYVQAAGGKVAAIVNVPHSSIAREADLVLPTHAGPEIGVASTKAFTCQLAVLAALAARIAGDRNQHSTDDTAKIMRSLTGLPRQISTLLDRMEDMIAPIARMLAGARDVLFVGRGLYFPIALEGALKLKELSYIHAEGYAAGELKHGPIALIDEDVPVIGLAPTGPLFDKTLPNLEQIKARRGQVYLVSDGSASVPLTGHIPMPDVDDVNGPFLYALPAQMIAYLTAVEKGTDVDQPRNLAKSVTVE